MTSPIPAGLTLLLPPSESKAESKGSGGTGAFTVASGVFRALGPRRQEVLEALWHEVDTGSTARQYAVLGVRGALAERAQRATQLLVAGNAPALPAWERYTGVVWKHLNPGELDASQLRRILIPSGLLGVSAAPDPTPDYRLKLSVRLSGIGSLQRWWAPALTEEIAAACEHTVLIDLLAAEHAAAIDWNALRKASTVIRVRFTAGGTTKPGRAGGHAAKAAKGVFAAWLLRNGTHRVDAFTWHDWSARRTHDEEIVVTKNAP